MYRGLADGWDNDTTPCGVQIRNYGHKASEICSKDGTGRPNITCKTESYGSFSLGCSNITNTFQIVNENGTNKTTYYAYQGRKFTVTYMLSF
jgi:hypothetical protein